MGEVDEFDHVHRVAHVLEHGGADGIGQQRGKALLQKTVAQQHVEIAALVDGGVDLVLAAGNGENVLHALFDGVPEGVVRGGVAGVERDDHIHMGVRERVARDVAHDEAQAVVAVLLRDGVAMLHHILLEVVAEDGRIHAALDGEVIVENEREVRFAAAEVENGDLLLLRGTEGVVHQLDEAVDLLVLIILRLDDAEVRRKHAEVDERGNVLALGKDVFLSAVMRLRRGGALRLAFRGAFVAAVRFADVLARLCFGAEHGLKIKTVQLLREQPGQLALRHVAVRDLLPLLVFKLKKRLAAQRQRADGHPGAADARERLRKHGLGERVEPRSEVVQHDAHAPNLSFRARCAA